MRVNCPSCGQAIPGADFDLGRGIAACRPCGEVVPLPAFAALERTDKLYKPDSVRFVERADEAGFVATMPPNRLGSVGALVFCIVWDAFLAFWYVLAFSGRVWFMAIFALGHLAVGVFITHATLVGLLNERTLRIARGRVLYRSGPIPFAGKLDVALEEVDAFDVVETTTRRGVVVPKLVVNLKNGLSTKLDVVTDDPIGTRYIAESFNDALKRARESEPKLATYRL